MNDNNKIRKVIIMSLAGLLFGSLFFTFGISIDSSFLPLISNYIIAMFMYISSFLAVRNNNDEKKKILYYIQYLSLFMMLFITYVFITKIT